MASPINNQPISTTVTTTTTPQTTTTVTLGDHTISTSSSADNVQTTASTTGSTATTTISQSANLDEVAFSPEITVTTSAPETGSAGPTASATHILGSTILRTRSDSSSSEASDISQTSSTSTQSELGTVGWGSDTHSTQASGSEDLGSLSGLRGTEAPKGSARPAGPGGLPEMKLPSYDPTNKASIITFLSDPSVQSKMLTKAGHLVFVDHDRGSFIFVRNGDWSTAESIAVNNGRTKDPITDPKDLEMCIAKFCMAYETMSSDWENNIRPQVAGQAGTSGKYDHLLLSMKFHTAVIYGPWNSKESSAGYTPSVWRRGTAIKTGNIWGDVGGLHSVNWSRVSGPSTSEGDVGFRSETPSTAPSTPASGFQPVINVNLGGISTHVSVGGATTTVTSNNETTESTDSQEVTSDSDDNKSVSSTSTQWEDPIHVEEDPEEDNLAPPPPIETSTPSTNITGMSNNSLQEILQNTRQHLDTVYDENGTHHEGNQTLGDVVRTSEDGTYQPTVLLDKTEASQDSAATQDVENSTDQNNELQQTLQAVRDHLDVVYPESNQGEPVPVNQNLGDVIDAVESGRTPESTIVIDSSSAGFDADSSEVHDTDNATTGSIDTDNATEDTAEVDAGTDVDAETDIDGATSEVSHETESAQQGDGASNVAQAESNELADTLKAVRNHLDVVYPESNQGEPVPVNQNLGDVIAAVESGRTPESTTVTDSSSAGFDADSSEVHATDNAATGSIDTDNATEDTAEVDTGTDVDAETDIDGATSDVDTGTDIDAETDIDGATSEASHETESAQQGDGASNVEQTESNELADALKAVRDHLDVVYPESNQGEPVPVNQNLGQVIRDVSTGSLKPTITDGAFTATKVIINDDGTMEAQASSTGPRVNAGGSAQLMATSGSGAQNAEDPGLEHLLPQLRAHLDQVFDSEGNLKQTGNEGTNIGSLIQDFQERTGSGGIVGPISYTIDNSTLATQQNATTEAVRHAPAQIATPLEGDSSRSDIHSAAQEVASALSNMVSSLQLAESGSRLNSALDVADTSSQGMSLMAAAKEVADSLSATLDTVTKQDS